MSPLLIIALSLLAGLILFIVGYFWQKHASSRYSRKHFHKITHSILDEALLSREIFEIEPDAPEVGYRSYRGQLETLDKDKLLFRMLDPIAHSLTSTPAYLLFRAKEQSGQQYFKFCCEIRKVIPEEPFQAVADSRQQRFRFIVHFWPCGAVHHVIQRPAQAIGEQGQLLLKVVQENPAPYQKHSGQQPAVQNHPQVFRNQKQTQQHQERGGQQTNCNEPQKLFDR